MVKYKNKKLVNVIMISTSIILLFCAYKLTNAWFNSSDERNNSFIGTQLLAEIDEVFKPNLEWSPKETTIKEVRVTNTGETKAFIRLSLYEFLLTLRVDMTDQSGNGNLKTVPSPIAPEAMFNRISTWEQSAKEHGTITINNKHYIVETTVVPNSDKHEGMYPANRFSITQGPLSYIKLNFSSSFKEVMPSATPSKNWVYEAGYFYYLQPLAPGESSEPLLDSISLSVDFPNKYKGSIYKLKIYMNAHDLTQPLLEEWKVSTTGTVYPVLKKQLK